MEEQKIKQSQWVYVADRKDAFKRVQEYIFGHNWNTGGKTFLLSKGEWVRDKSDILSAYMMWDLNAYCAAGGTLIKSLGNSN